ncbi:MAG: putative cytochrome c oxidase subunit 3 [Planctomycetes bacterium]|nr:putative cytochrome c oxidase subunit 3 [Planctomycetota bacterium]
MSHSPSQTATGPIAPIDSLGQTEYGRRTFGYTPGKFAMWLFLASDAMGFVGLVGAYVVLRAGARGDWRPHQGDYGVTLHKDASGNPVPGLPEMDPIITGLMTFVLILSSFFMVKALSAVQRGDKAGLVRWLGLTTLGGLAFLGGQVYEYTHLISNGFVMSAHPYAATFFICTGFHGAHVLAGVIYLSCMWIGSVRGKYGADNASPIELVGLFWHFVDLVWIIIFTVIYLF